MTDKKETKEIVHAIPQALLDHVIFLTFPVRLAPVVSESTRILRLISLEVKPRGER